MRIATSTDALLVAQPDRTEANTEANHCPVPQKQIRPDQIARARAVERASGAHTHTRTYHVLHAVGDVEGEVGGGSPGAPGDVAEGRAVRHHAVHPLEEVLDPLLGLGREVLERERRPAILRRLLNLLDHLHLEPNPPLCSGASPSPLRARAPMARREGG